MCFQEGSHSISVFMRDTRTTCDVEGYNGALGKKIKGNIRFFKFFGHLQDEELAKSIEFRQHIASAGLPQPAKKRKFRVNIICVHIIYCAV